MTDAAEADAIEILVDGFFDNPVLSWIFQDESTRAEAIDAWFRFWMKSYGDEGLLVVEGADGAALWAKPDAPPAAGGAMQALVELVSSYNGGRTGLVLGTLARVKPLDERHWYLNAIAARRGERARGVGARLIEPFLDRADSEKTPIYLESSNPRNLTFYRRYGFEDLGPCIDLPGAGPVLQPMWRPVGAAR